MSINNKPESSNEGIKSYVESLSEVERTALDALLSHAGLGEEQLELITDPDLVQRAIALAEEAVELFLIEEGLKSEQKDRIKAIGKEINSIIEESID